MGIVETAYFFSDETGLHSAGRYFLVVGVAFTKYRQWIADDLHHAERVSCKGKQDWKGTKNIHQRIRYISEVLQIERLRGTVFYAAYENNKKEYWTYTVDALSMAIQRFAADRHSIVRHQGFNFKSREKLKKAMSDAGCSFEIQSGSQQKRAEIRLADALAGYLGMSMYGDSTTAGYFPDVPEWFVDLKHEAPLQEY